ncbi:PXA domain-containing protein [Zopfochytrium polystomum]|nr:PXA domain-containing protein [Zopfochytrium polystomum]
MNGVLTVVTECTVLHLLIVTLILFLSFILACRSIFFAPQEFVFGKMAGSVLRRKLFEAGLSHNLHGTGQTDFGGSASTALAIVLDRIATEISEHLPLESWIDFLCADLPNLLLLHLRSAERESNLTRQSSRISKRVEKRKRSEQAKNHESTAKLQLHHLALQDPPTSEEAYIRRISQKLVDRFVPLEELESNLLRFMLTEIVAFRVLLPIVRNICAPEYFRHLLVQAVSVATDSSSSPNRAGRASQSTEASLAAKDPPKRLPKPMLQVNQFEEHGEPSLSIPWSTIAEETSSTATSPTMSSRSSFSASTSSQSSARNSRYASPAPASALTQPSLFSTPRKLCGGLKPNETKCPFAHGSYVGFTNVNGECSMCRNADAHTGDRNDAPSDNNNSKGETIFDIANVIDGSCCFTCRNATKSQACSEITLRKFPECSRSGQSFAITTDTQENRCFKNDTKLNSQCGFHRPTPVPLSARLFREWQESKHGPWTIGDVDVRMYDAERLDEGNFALLAEFVRYLLHWDAPGFCEKILWWARTAVHAIFGKLINRIIIRGLSGVAKSCEIWFNSALAQARPEHATSLRDEAKTIDETVEFVTVALLDSSTACWLVGRRRTLMLVQDIVRLFNEEDRNKQLALGLLDSVIVRAGLCPSK